MEEVVHQPNRYEKPWLQTFTGIAFPVLDPEPEHIDIRDIAHALSNLCRFAGHTRKFYSVAQHCVLASFVAPDHIALDVLLHDATEAYVVDLPRPIKHSGFVDGYRDIEYGVWLAIARKFDLEITPPTVVKMIDAKMLRTEQRDLMCRPLKPWQDVAEPYNFTIHPVPPDTAAIQFMARFNKLTRERERQNAYTQSQAA